VALVVATMLRGMRKPVSDVLDLYAAGLTAANQILADSPS